MDTFIVWWDPRKPYSPRDGLTIHTPFGSAKPAEGDLLYIVFLGPDQRLMARLGIVDVNTEDALQRTTVNIDCYRTAFFAPDFRSAPVLTYRLRCPHGAQHKQATLLGDVESELLRSSCEESDDYSTPYLPVNWAGISNQTLRYVTQMKQYGDNRSDFDIAVGSLAANYTTGALPGPAPVYLNAAQIIIGSSIQFFEQPYTPGADVAKTYRSTSVVENDWTPSVSECPNQPNTRNTAPLTEAAIKSGINGNLSKMSLYSPDARRHQEILLSLRNRLVDMGLQPKYDRLVDCKVMIEGSLLYFEVKSSQPRNMLREAMLGVGQIEYYKWLDLQSGIGDVKGHLIVEDRGERKHMIPDFVRAKGLGFSWSKDLDKLMLDDLAGSALAVPH